MQCSAAVSCTFRRAMFVLLAAGLMLLMPAGTLAQEIRIVSVTPSTVTPGAQVTIKGRGLADVRAVTINGFPVRFRVRSTERITARAPGVAGRGTVVVVTALGTVVGPAPFIVRPRLGVEPSSVPPSGRISVRGRGFIPGEIVDFSVDAAAAGRTVATRSGRIDGAGVIVPANTLPGPHVFGALGRWSGVPVTADLDVSTAWRQWGFTPGGARFNRFENRIIPATVETLTLA